MTLSRKSVIAGVILVVLGAAVVYGIYYLRSDAFKYRGLVTHDEPEISDSERTYFEQQLHTAQAALESQKKTMVIHDVDWNLYLSIAWNASAVGDLLTAHKILDEYFTLSQMNVQAYSLYGDVLVRMQDFAGAEKAYKTAADLQPTEEAYRKLIDTIRLNPADGSREDEVKTLLEDGVSKVGQTSWFMTELAQWYLAHNDCQSALDHYKVAKSLLPAGNTAIAQDIAKAQEQCKNTN